MTRTVSQTERVEGERSRNADAAQPVVDRLYRLQPADLGGLHARPRDAIVRFVGTQGIERPSPVLHFEGIAKPLVLDRSNVAAITRIAGSPLQRDWVRRKLVLAVTIEGQAPVIRLFAPGDPALRDLQRKSMRVERAQARREYLRRALRAAVLFAGLLAAAFVAIYLVENWAALLAAALAAFDALRNSL
jgi:hypothetical protein